jgi:cell fate regulator YaaT (PSP1 superfamily)
MLGYGRGPRSPNLFLIHHLEFIIRMSLHHIVRVGPFGHVGRFRALDAARYPRGARVVVRTSRGLETGEVLAPPDDDDHAAASDGTILRGMTVEDHLLAARLEGRRDEAFAACQTRLQERGVSAVLMDVEHLFDGRSLYFYFLGEPPGEVERLTAELAEVYDAEVEFRRFADTLADGCGPGCGTEDAAGHGCTSCATGCAIASACHSTKT